MDKIFIFGHKKPDTDSVCGAITLSYLKNKLGYNTEPRILGDLNNETKFVLDYFNVSYPKYLDNVFLEIKNVNYHKDYFVNENDSILNTYNFLKNKSITGTPLVDNNNIYKNLITLKTIAKEIIEGNFTKLETSYKNILDVLNGESILKFDDEINGEILAATFRSTTFLNNIKLKNNHILIVGDRHSIIEYAVETGVKLLVIVGNTDVHDKHIEVAKKNKVNIIRTNLDSFHTAKLLGLSNYIKTLIDNKTPVTFKENDILNYFLEESKRLKHNNYPIINKNNKCLGLLRVTDITEKRRKKVILVDHNELEQSVNGLCEAEIIEIVDHHKIGDLTTNNPINFRNMAVGSTNTIIYFLFKESNIILTNEISGLILSGILSDTLLLTSPTTTEIDKAVVIKLSQILNIDYKEYGLNMLKAGTNFGNSSINKIINTDLKIFSIDKLNIAVSQILSFDVADILDNKDKYIDELDKINNSLNANGVLLLVTDILNNGSYILFTENLLEIIRLTFKNHKLENGNFIKDCISRKKQVIPNLVKAIEEN